MGSKKHALLLSALLLSGCSGDISNGLSPHNPPTKIVGVSQNELKQENVEIAEEKKTIRIEHVKKQNETTERTYWDVPLSHDLQDYISRLCEQYSVDEKLVYAIMKQESRFDPKMISETNDYGLMGVNEINFSDLRSELGITNFLNPFQNSHAGIYMLGKLKKKYRYENIVLIGYNQGEGSMEDTISTGIYFTSYCGAIEANKSQLHKKD